MITEDYVSYEVAKLLKEKGFDEPCIAVYEEGVLRINTLCYYHNSELSSYICAPTLQMSMKWMRDVHNIAIEPMLLSNGWFCQIERILDGFCKEYICETDSYKTYEDAVEAALYSLENLI